MLYGYNILIYCTSKIYKPDFTKFIAELNTKLIAKNWRIMIFCTDSDLGKDNKNNKGSQNIFDLINFDIADAVLFSKNCILDKEVVSKLKFKAKRRNIPVLQIEGHDDDTYNILFNQKKGFEQIVRHMVEYHKIKDLHFMAGTPDSIESMERLEIFKKVLQDNYIPFDNSMVSYGFFWDLPTMKATQKLIDFGKLPKAMICANDAMAMAVNSVLRMNGQSCPDDMLISGYDGINPIFYSTPKITSCICNQTALAAKTAELLLSICSDDSDNSETKKEPFTTLVDPTPFISESCGCKPHEPTNTFEIVSDVSNLFSRYRNEDCSLNELSVVIKESNNLEELIQNIKDKLLYNVSCLVKPECLDSSKDPDINYSKSAYSDEMYVLLDSDNNKPEDNCYMKTKDLAPRMKDLLDIYCHPVIFTPICNKDIPLGYLTFCFNNYDKQNYSKVCQTASWLGIALTGYRNKQYKQYLLQKIDEMQK